jgi:serine/threonine-protein kinase
VPATAASERYQIVRKLDSGGMAEVYQGILTAGHGVEKPVAIKRVLPHLAKNEKFIKMFIDEARLSMRMSHANIVQMFDIGMSNDTYFLVMEFVDGANLKTILEATRARGASMPMEYAIWVMVEVCKGLDYAHALTDRDGNQLGIVHRDISPPNILISKRGEVKIVDFGLAKAGTQLEKTDPGVVKGKFSYLSPELAHGQEPDARSDIFAVGILLFELLTGKRLFYGETDYATIQLVRAARVPRLSAINPRVAADLEAIVLRALARDPAARYQSGQELGSDLAQYLFAHGQRVTAFDIAKLVTEITATTAPKRAEPSLIDALIQEEILRFTSLDPSVSPQGGQQLSPGGDDGARPLDAALFEDPRSWNLDPNSESGGGGTPRPAGGLTATGRPRTMAPPAPGEVSAAAPAAAAGAGAGAGASAPPPPPASPAAGGVSSTGRHSRPAPAAAPASAAAPDPGLATRLEGATRPDTPGAASRTAGAAAGIRGRTDKGGGAGGRIILLTLLVILLLGGGALLAQMLGAINLPLPFSLPKL